MAPPIDIDPALLGEFVDESLQGLSEIGNLFISLEQDPENTEIVQSIFRTIHSMKGNSAFFGFVRVKTLSHEMETILDLVRNDALNIDQNISTVLLEGCDALEAMLQRAHAGDSEITDEQVFDALVDRVMALSSSTDADPAQIAERMLKQLGILKELLPEDDPIVLDNLDQLIEDAKQLLPDDAESADESASDRKPWPQAYRDLFLFLENWDSTPPDASKAIAAREMAAALLPLFIDDAQRDLLNDAFESYDLIFDSIGIDPLLRDTLKDALDVIPMETLHADEDSTEDATTTEAPAPESGTPPASTGTGGSQQVQKTMRIPEVQIDLFLTYVGELLVIGDMFDHLHKRLTHEDTDIEILSSFKIANSTFSTLSNELQNSIMSIRKVPISVLLNKAPRIIRDIATAKGKQMELDVEGNDIMLDKSLMDVLDAPLTHMLRNAADHGIEMPEVRENSGKSPVGHVQLITREEGNFLILEIKDDGAGLDLEAIGKKVTEQGLVPVGTELTSDDLINFIFSSGVSTAAEITDVSGRGVGMDAVKRSVEEVGGKIEVETTQGNGSIFRIILPKTVTTRIIEGFLIGCNGLKFVIPLDRIYETSRFIESIIVQLPNGNACLKRNDTLYPLVGLPDILGGAEKTADDNEEDLSVVVTIKSSQSTYALHVDEILGVQKVVIREIVGLTGCHSISGGALMGDGTIAFILDMDEIFNLCTSSEPELVEAL